MKTLCYHCGEDSDTCVGDVDGHLQCEACHSHEIYLRQIASQARRERVEAVWAEQDERSARDGGYKVQPINMRIPQIGEK